MIRAKIYRILILGLFYTYNFFGIAAESHKYTITVYSEIIPIYDNTKSKLDLCRLTKTLNSNIDLIISLDKIKTYTDLIDHLITDTDIKTALDALIDNFISAKCPVLYNTKLFDSLDWQEYQLSHNTELLKSKLESNLLIASALINIVATKSENISKKLIRTYYGQGEEPLAPPESSEIYPIQLFKITDDHGEEITTKLAGKLTETILNGYIEKYQQELLSILPNRYIGAYRSYITYILKLINEKKDLIFKNSVYTQINYCLDFMIEYIKKMSKEIASQHSQIGGESILMNPMTFKDFVPILSVLFVLNDFKSTDIEIVKQARLDLDELEDLRKDILLIPVNTVTEPIQNERQKGEILYNFLAYTQLLQLRFNPYQ